jgi:amidohydrolase
VSAAKDHATEPRATTVATLWQSIEPHLVTRQERWIRLRRRIHAAPDASGAEQATTALVAAQLREAGVEPRIMDEDRGVITDIDLGAPEGSWIALRAELDCVAVNDEKQAAYASTRPGLCHACGHDAHTTIVLAAGEAIAANLDQLRAARWRHNLRLIFQPAEETATGARSMIRQGAIDGVRAIIALHVDPYLDAGRIGYAHGPMTAACKTFRITIAGRGGHSARPHEAVDPIPAATAVIGQFYQLGPRSMDGRFPLALTIGSIHAGAAPNAIPDRAELLGTLRTARLEDAELVQRRMEAIIRGVGESTGCEIGMEFLHVCPPTDNDPALVDALRAVISDLLGPSALQRIEVPSLGGEDFAFYQELIPAAFLRLGAGLSDGRARRPLHSSLFDIDEAALLVGARVTARAALELAAKGWSET